jgi:hypothetical protein
MMTVLWIIAGTVALLFIAAIFMRRNHYEECNIVIEASNTKVFDFVKLVANQEAFNKHAQAGTDRQKTITGTDGTVGFIYAWNGSKEAGQGEKEIIAIEEGRRIETEIRFVKPMVVSSRMVMETQALPDGNTQVTWSNAGDLKYPLNLLIPFMEKSVTKDMQGSLVMLKELLEGDNR